MIEFTQLSVKDNLVGIILTQRGLIWVALWTPKSCW